MKTLKEKFKTFSFWTGLSAAVVILMQSIGKMFGFAVNEQGISDIIMAICGVLIVFGIVNKPEKEQKNTQENDFNNNSKINENKEN